MLASAIRKGWKIPESVYEEWPTKAIAIVEDEKNNMRERVRAMELMVRMHGQNQADHPATQRHEHVGAMAVKIVEDENWYGNADAIPSEAATKPVAATVVASAIQGAGERPAVGKNGNGSNGGH